MLSPVDQFTRCCTAVEHDEILSMVEKASQMGKLDESIDIVMRSILQEARSNTVEKLESKVQEIRQEVESSDPTGVLNVERLFESYKENLDFLFNEKRARIRQLLSGYSDSSSS